MRTVGILTIIPFVCMAIFAAVVSVQFDRNCKGRLKRAADANSVETARDELAAAVKYLEGTGKTSGYTSVLYRTPDEDVGFWFKNLKSSLETLDKLPPAASELERSNLLMKLRETLLDSHGEHGAGVTVPTGISRFPGNAGFAVLFILSLLVASVGTFLIAVSFDLGSC